MKTKSILNLLALGTVIALLSTAPSAHADAALKATSSDTPAPAKAAANLREYTGTISAVDAADRTVKVDKYFWDKTFNLAENCTFAVGVNQEASLESLRPDMEVVVNYQEADGVLVATHIAQRWYTHTGYIRTATPLNHEIVMDRMGMARKFKVNDSTQYIIHKDEAKLGDLKPGQKVTITYTRQDDVWLTQKVVDKSETFTGTVEAIDAGANTLKVKNMLTTHKFNLGDGCKIVLDSDTSGRLRDLRIGQKVTIDYEEVKGVMVAARIELGEPQTVAAK
jgi:Cu/Ag efflux protein CusF